MSDALTQQMHESRARRLVEAETAARSAAATIKDLTDRLTDAEWRASCAEDRAREMEIPGIGHEYALQAMNFADYLRKQGKPADSVPTDWPLHTPPAGWSPDQLPAHDDQEQVAS